MSCFIISPTLENTELKLTLLNKAAEELYNSCRDSSRNPIALLDNEVTNENIENSSLNGKDVYVFYGPLVDGLFSGSDGDLVFDLRSNFVRDSVKGKNFYVIDTEGSSLVEVGKRYINIGAKAYVGLKGSFVVFQSKALLRNILEYEYPTNYVIALINYIAIALCSGYTNVSEVLDSFLNKCADINLRRLIERSPNEAPFCTLEFMHHFACNIDFLD